MTAHEIMTLEEVAKHLRVSERTVYDWANRGEIPCGKIGTAWRFKRSQIDRWVDERLGGGAGKPAARPLGLDQLLGPERVIVDAFSRKVDVLNRLIDVLAETPEVKDRKALADAVYHRESLMSTGIGHQVAVPHVRLASVHDLVMAVALSTVDLADYESLDTLPVRLVFMIAARQDQHAQHIKTLSAISAFIKAPGMLQQLLDAPDAATLFSLLAAPPA